MQSSFAVQPKAVLIDWDRTVMGHLHNYITQMIIVPFLQAKIEGEKELSTLKTMREMINKGDLLGVAKLYNYANKEGNGFNETFMKEAGVWEKLNQQIEIERNNPNSPEVQLLKRNFGSLLPVSHDDMTLKDFFVKLADNHIAIGIHSFSFYLPIMKLYLEKIVGLPKEVLDQIKFDVSFPGVNEAGSQSKIQTGHLTRLQAAFDFQPEDILVIDDGVRHIQGATAKGYQTILVDLNAQSEFLSTAKTHFAFFQNQQPQIQPQPLQPQPSQPLQPPFQPAINRNNFVFGAIDTNQSAQHLLNSGHPKDAWLIREAQVNSPDKGRLVINKIRYQHNQPAGVTREVLALFTHKEDKTKGILVSVDPAQDIQKATQDAYAEKGFFETPITDVNEQVITKDETVSGLSTLLFNKGYQHEHRVSANAAQKVATIIQKPIALDPSALMNFFSPPASTASETQNVVTSVSSEPQEMTPASQPQSPIQSAINNQNFIFGQINPTTESSNFLINSGHPETAWLIRESRAPNNGMLVVDRFIDGNDQSKGINSLPVALFSKEEIIEGEKNEKLEWIFDPNLEELQKSGFTMQKVTGSVVIANAGMNNLLETTLTFRGYESENRIDAHDVQSTSKLTQTTSTTPVHHSSSSATANPHMLTGVNSTMYPHHSEKKSPIQRQEQTQREENPLRTKVRGPRQGGKSSE